MSLTRDDNGIEFMITITGKKLDILYYGLGINTYGWEMKKTLLE